MFCVINMLNDLGTEKKKSRLQHVGEVGCHKNILVSYEKRLSKCQRKRIFQNN